MTDENRGAHCVIVSSADVRLYLSRNLADILIKIDGLSIYFHAVSQLIVPGAFVNESGLRIADLRFYPRLCCTEYSDFR